MKRAKKTQNTDDWTRYKKSKYKVTKIIGQSKEEYFRAKVEQNRQDPKKFWNLIKTLSRDNINKYVNISSLKDKNRVSHTDKQETAELLVTELFGFFLINHVIFWIHRRRLLIP